MTDPILFPEGLDAPLVHPWVGSSRALVEAVAGRQGHWWLRGSRMQTKAALMDEWAAVAQFPPYFGGTWDALRDALADLPMGGAFLILDAEQLLRKEPPSELETLGAVLRAVGEELAPKPFRVILQVDPDHQGALLQKLQTFGIV